MHILHKHKIKNTKVKTQNDIFLKTQNAIKINPLLTKQVRLRLLLSWSIKTQKGNLASIQPSSPRTWSIILYPI